MKKIDNNIKIILPNEIIDNILKLTYIKCKCCSLEFNIIFYKKQSKFYYCSKECYNFL